MLKLRGMQALAMWGLLALAGGVTSAWAEDTPGAPAAPAQEQTVTPPAATTTQASEPAPGSPEEVVCRKEEATTGTMLGRRKICKTRKEWADLARDSQNALRESQDGSLRTNPSTGSGN